MGIDRHSLPCNFYDKQCPVAADSATQLCIDLHSQVQDFVIPGMSGPVAVGIDPPPPGATMCQVINFVPIVK